MSGDKLPTVSPSLLGLGCPSSFPSCSSPRRAANSLARSAIVTVVSCFFPFRTKPILALVPGFKPAI